MFRFTIRDVLWLMVVVAMGAMWWMESKRSFALATEVESLTPLRQLQREADDRAQRIINEKAWILEDYSPKPPTTSPEPGS